MGLVESIDRTELQDALAEADSRILLMVLVHLTGECRWLQAPYLPVRDVRLIADGKAGLPEHVGTEIRSAVLEVMCSQPVPVVDCPSDELMVQMMSICLGESVDPRYVPVMKQEMGLLADGVVALGESGRSAPTATIIGAGVSGICAAVRLARAGVETLVLEKDESVGGGWFENRYPDCGVDTPNQFYSYSFAPHDGWSRHFSLRDEIYDYLRRCVVDFELTDKIHLGTTVSSASWDDAAHEWVVTYTDGGGSVRRRKSDILISAVGQLNRPAVPHIDGLGGFTGRTFHSARWPDDLDLTGLRVGVVGAGASAMQFVPKIAEQVDSLVIFQRSPQWARPIGEYRAEVSPSIQYLLGVLPYYRSWLRFTLAWRYGDGLHPHLQKDPKWEFPERSLNRVNDKHRAELTEYIRRELRDAPDLIDEVVPRFPPYAKRILIDNGWYRTLTRPNVELVTDRVAQVDRGTVIAGDGSAYELDVLIMATGFDALNLLGDLEIVGRNGIRLADQWGTDDPRAYLGITVPNFPNFFVMYGPNTNLAHGGSIIFQAECQTRYILDLLRQMLERGATSAEVLPAVHDQYNRRVDEAHANMVWTHPGVSPWYRNSAGRVVSNSPWRLVDYWHMTCRAKPEDYELRRVSPPTAMSARLASTEDA